VARTRFDLDAVRRGVVGQYALVDAAVSAIPPDGFDRPTRLGDWRVAELVAHLGMSNLPRYLAADSAPKPEIDVIDWAVGCAPAAGGVDERARGMAEEARPAELRSVVDETRRAVTTALSDIDPDFVVPAIFGAIRLNDYLATRCVELIVHSLDLAAATGREVPLDPDALGVAVKLLAQVLASQHPGKAVELRVPPYAAVQLLEGPRHTRGTPGSVVEVRPSVWLELSTGRIDWAEAIASGGLSASGERSDLSPYLPVLQ
jgi:uncharacterized protein (TIGR03083 family)